MTVETPLAHTSSIKLWASLCPTDRGGSWLSEHRLLSITAAFFQSQGTAPCLALHFCAENESYWTWDRLTSSPATAWHMHCCPSHVGLESSQNWQVAFHHLHPLLFLLWNVLWLGRFICFNLWTWMHVYDLYFLLLLNVQVNTGEVYSYYFLAASVSLALLKLWVRGLCIK